MALKRGETNCRRDPLETPRCRGASLDDVVALTVLCAGTDGHVEDVTCSGGKPKFGRLNSRPLPHIMG